MSRGGSKKPDLRLAESYIPAALLMIKGIFYTLMVPLALAIHESFILFIITVFLLVLYVDHLYLVLPNANFIDTTALCLDIMASNLCMLFIADDAQGVSMNTTLVLFVWCIGCIIHAYAAIHDKKIRTLTLHCMAFFFSLLFALLSCLDSRSASFHYAPGNTTIMAPAPAKRIQSIHFFFRCIMYIVLVLVEAYTFRPIMQHENERHFFCKYGALLLSQWQVAAAIFLILLASQILKISHTMECAGDADGAEEGTLEKSNSHTLPNGIAFHECSLLKNTSGLKMPETIIMHDVNHTPFHVAGGISIVPNAGPVDSDVMEAFRLAKQQYTAHHGDKTN